MGRGKRVLRSVSKKNETIAELSFWYGFDVGALPKSRQLGLLANLERVKAQHMIHRGQYDPTDYEGVSALYLQAYGDEGLAQQAGTEAARALIKREAK